MTSPNVPEGTAPNQPLKQITSPEPGSNVDVGFYNAQDGVKGRDGGPYLDYEERYAGEVRRASQEGREPAEYGENVPAVVGTTLVTAGTIEDNSGYSNPSMAHKQGLEVAFTDDTFTGNKGLADPISVLPVQVEGAPQDETGADLGDGETQDQADAQDANPNATLVDENDDNDSASTGYLTPNNDV